MQTKNTLQQIANMVDENGEGICINAVVPFFNEGMNLKQDNCTFTNTNVENGAFNFAGDGSVVSPKVTLGSFCDVLEVTMANDNEVKGIAGHTDITENDNEGFYQSNTNIVSQYRDLITGFYYRYYHAFTIDEKFIIVLNYNNVTGVFSTYINGLLINSLTGKIGATLTPINRHRVGCFGYTGDTSAYFFTGQIHSSFLFNKAFTAEEVKQLTDRLMNMEEAEITITNDAYILKTGLTSTYNYSDEMYFEHDGIRYAEVPAGLSVDTKLKLRWARGTTADKYLYIKYADSSGLPSGVYYGYFRSTNRFTTALILYIILNTGIGKLDIRPASTVLYLNNNTNTTEHNLSLLSNIYDGIVFASYVDGLKWVGDISTIYHLTIYVLIQGNSDITGSINGIKAVNRVEFTDCINITGVIPSTILTKYLFLENTAISQSDVDQNIIQRDLSGVTDGILDLRSTFAPTWSDAAVQDAYDSLIVKSWTIYTD